MLSSKLDSYRQYQLAQVAAMVIAVAGLTVLIGVSGQISIGHGAFMFVGGYTTAMLLMHLNWNLALVIVASAVVAGVAGAIMGIAAARLRGPYLAGATLMLAVALPAVAYQWQSVFGGDQGLNFVVNAPGFLGPELPADRVAGVGVLHLRGDRDAAAGQRAAQPGRPELAGAPRQRHRRVARRAERRRAAGARVHRQRRLRRSGGRAAGP